MTELCSPSEAEEPLTIRGLHAFTVEMLRIYESESRLLTDEAEDLVARGIQMRETAMQMMARASELALEYARAKDEVDALEPW